MARKRAAALLRVSTDHQDLASQREAIKRWADAQGYEVVWFEEEATCGASKRRPTLDRLLADARKRRFDVVVVAALDRIARDVVKLVLTLDALESAGVYLVSLREGLDFRRPMGRAMASLLGAVAEIERAAIRSRVMAGLDVARKKGKTLGRPRYSLSDRQVARLRELQAQGVSLRRIVRERMVTAVDGNGKRKVPSIGFLSQALRDAG